MADKTEREKLEEAFANDISGLSEVDAHALLKAAQRDLARRQKADPEAETRRRVSQMSDNEFFRWSREQMP